MAGNKQEDVFDLLYRNMSFNGGFSQKNGNGIFTTLAYLIVSIIVPLILGIIYCIVKVTPKIFNAVGNLINELISSAKDKEELNKFKEQEKLNKDAINKIYEKSIAKLFLLITNNLRYIQYSIIKTVREGTVMMQYINFTVNDYKTGETIVINDLINQALHYKLDINNKGGDYLKGAIKLEPHEIERLENDLREVLQLPLMLIVA